MTNILFTAEKSDLYLGDTIYHLILSAILLLVAKHFAWGLVTDMMEKRRRQVIEDIDKAANERKKAEILAGEREEQLKSSRREATQILSIAKTNAETVGRDILNQANEEAKSIREKAKADAIQAKNDALNEAQAQVTDISVQIAEKVIARNLSTADQKDLVDQFIKGLNK